MTAQDLKGTKLKILKAANKLFAKKGFAAVSIREISTMANVNLAAINYHFKNKENLYHSVFYFNHYNLTKVISDLELKSKSTEELAVNVFRFFCKDGIAILNTFKTLISDQTDTMDLEDNSDVNSQFAPPGEGIILQKIKDDLNDDISYEDGCWATKMIFSLIVHLGVVINTPIIKKHCDKDGGLTPEKAELFISHSVKAHISYLKLNKNIFNS